MARSLRAVLSQPRRTTVDQSNAPDPSGDVIWLGRQPDEPAEPAPTQPDPT